LFFSNDRRLEGILENAVRRSLQEMGERCVQELKKEVYKRECQTVINVVKMLVSNDLRLKGILQNAVRRSLQEMGQRCVQELEKEIRPAT
ncbi:unnamed protein product, partial [Porites evermanni]